MRFICLLYHDVFPEGGDYGSLGESAARYHVPLETFRRHLDRIAETGMRVLSHGEMTGASSGGGDGVGITFDDGWKWSLEIAAAELAERRMPASYFITTGFLDRPHFAGASELRALDPTLFTIGSHGSTHRMLSSLAVPEIIKDLRESRERLEQILGRRVTAVSIPGGAVDVRVRRAAVEAGYDAIFDSSIRVNPGRLGARGIGRLGITRYTTPETLDRYLRFDLTRDRVRKGVLALPKKVLGMRLYSWTRRLLMGETTKGQHHFDP